MKLIYKMMIACVFCLILFGINGSVFAVTKAHARGTAASQVNSVVKANESSDSAIAGKMVNINDADAATLEKVKGIGPKKARAIIAYRDEHGKFQLVDDLANVKGIGKKRLGKMKSSLTV